MAKLSTMILALLATMVALAATLYTHFDSLPFLMPLALCSGVGYLVTSLFLANYKPTRYGEFSLSLCPLCLLWLGSHHPVPPLFRAALHLHMRSHYYFFYRPLTHLSSLGCVVSFLLRFL